MVPSEQHVDEAQEQYQSFVKHVVTAEFQNLIHIISFNKELMNCRFSV